MIFGASSPKVFGDLCRLNEQNDLTNRYGIGYINSKTAGDLIYKKEGYLDEIYTNFNIYLGSCDSYQDSDNQTTPAELNPVTKGHWVVALCGSVTNLDLLSRDFKVEFKTAASVIAYLLDYFEKQLPASTTHREIFAALSTFNRLEGRLSAWTYYTPAKRIFLVRASYPVYYNIENHAFSSTKFDNSFLLKNKVIYKYEERSLVPFLKLNLKDDPFYMEE